MRAGERQERAGLLVAQLVVAVVGDVLAETLLAGAGQADHGRVPREAARHVEDEPFERVRVDLDG